MCGLKLAIIPEIKGKRLPLERREDSRMIRDNLTTRIIQFEPVQLIWIIGLMLIFHLQM